MKKNIVFIVIGLLVLLVGLLLYQNNQLKKKVTETSKEHIDTVSVVIPEPSRANPDSTSPFDKPNVDPMASHFRNDYGHPEKGPATTIVFEKTAYDFGRISEGEKVSTSFKFKNTGNVPFVIDRAYGSCGCTVPFWPQDPIKPGESAEIKVVFDSEGKHGEVEKTVTVVGNTRPVNTVLQIKSTIIPQDK
ncbi:MAG TPA: DUF1573 domain-containing protein [Chitinophagales bacterium]|nr:DUF1573 domain-containing protein [Chitinophagales bacterium]